ncbi:hypothetical protein [Photobacterium kasasachensis]|uniref:hypothetical protein n=1 Tax=Photobacterium kasasachensis TaxID=2910240 RepID=UPI003D1157BE
MGAHKAAAEKARAEQIKSFEGVGPIFDWRDKSMKYDFSGYQPIFDWRAINDSRSLVKATGSVYRDMSNYSPILDYTNYQTEQINKLDCESVTGVIIFSNCKWKQWESESPYLSEVAGRNSVLSTAVGLANDLGPSGFASMRGVFSASNNSKGLFSGGNPSGTSGFYRLSNPNPTLSTPAIGEPIYAKPSFGEGVKAARFTNMLKTSARSGGVTGAVLAPIGRAVEFGLEGKSLQSQEFVVNASLDSAKGMAAGSVGAYVGTAVGAGVAAEFAAAGAAAGSAVAPVVGAAVGFLVGWGASLLIENGVYNTLELRDWRF